MMAQNYYLYNQDGIFTVIPWDFNMSFGTFGGGNMLASDIYTPVLNAAVDQLPLIGNLLAVEEYKQRYTAIIGDYLQYLGEPEAMITGLADLIRPAVEADPTRFVSLDDFNRAVTRQEGDDWLAELEQGFFPMPHPGMGDMFPGGFRGAEPPPGFPGGDGGPGLPGDFDPAQPPPQPGGGGLQVLNTTPLINFIRARVDQIQQQLAD